MRYSSSRLHEFQTSEPTSSRAQENVLVEGPRANSQNIEKLPDKDSPIGSLEVNESWTI
jgi:hypothetical protein